MSIPRRFVFAVGLLSLFGASSAFAEVPLTDRQVLKRSMKQAKRSMRQARRLARGQSPSATGSQALIDSSGLKWFINTDITFSTTSSASGAASEASYTHAVAATTLAGGTTSSTLNDAFDGYQTVCLSLNNTVANCATGNANFIIYNQNGAPATTECMGTTVNRQVVFPTMTTGTLEISRKVYVPDTDSFARWLTSVKNTGGAPATITLVSANNLGSDNNTAIVTTSSGDAVVDLADTWVTSFQTYSGTTSSDVRLGHVLQGPGARAPLAGINFADGDDNPFWGYTTTIAPGETARFLNFGVGQPSKAAAAAKAMELVSLPPAARQCLTNTELSEVRNFAVGNYYTVPLCRVADTRGAPGPSGGPALMANALRTFPATGVCGVPADATSVAIVATTVGETDFGDLKLFAAGTTPIPVFSTLNFAVNHVRANNAIVKVGAGGAIGVQCDMPPGSTGTTNFLFDVYGYFK